MANGDDPYGGSYFDQSFGAFGDQNPVGTTTAIGNTAQNPNDPLIDWASNLQKDDLVKLLQDHPSAIQDLAARGIAPPDPNAIHDANDAFGTPSRSSRSDVVPASPLDAPVRTDPTGRIMGNLSGGILPPGFQPQGQQPDMAYTSQAFPGGTSPGTSTPPDQPPGQVYVPGKGMVQRPVTVPTAPAPAPVPTAPKQPAPAPYVSPGAGSNNPFDPRFVGPMPSADQLGLPQRPAPAAPAAVPPGTVIKQGGDKTEEDQTEEDKNKPKEPTREEKIDKALSTLGKAMQGVKAPPPLQPPQIGAPHVRANLSAGMSPIAQLLGAMSRTQTGQVPPSLMPVMKLLGRV